MQVDSKLKCRVEADANRFHGGEMEVRRVILLRFLGCLAAQLSVRLRGEGRWWLRGW